MLSKMPLISEKVANAALERIHLDVKRASSNLDKDYISRVVYRISKDNPYLGEKLSSLLVHGSTKDDFGEVGNPLHVMLVSAMVADFVYRAINDQIEINEMEDAWGEGT